MELLALVEEPDHVCWRYRIAPFESALEERGWTLRTEPLERQFFARMRQFRRAATADVVLLQRKLLRSSQLAFLRYAAKKLVFDVDDAVFHRDSNAVKPPQCPRRQASFRATVAAADAVLAGNQYLAGEAERWTHGDRVRHLPTTIDTARYRCKTHQATASPRLVWIGSRSTVAAIRETQPHLAAATARVPGLELLMICDTFPALPGVRVVPEKWASETEADQLASADIGLSWLPDHPWSRGKCGLKVLQYMAAGLPVIANPLGVHRDLVIDGVTGILASTPAEWAAAIARLTLDFELRRRMGDAARRRAEQHYSVQSWAGEFVEAIGQAAGIIDAPPVILRHPQVFAAKRYAQFRRRAPEAA